MKSLYGRQEQALRGDNPAKMGRPSRVYQTYIIASFRMVLEVEVLVGNQPASQYAQPGLWAWLDRAVERAAVDRLEPETASGGAAAGGARTAG